MNDTCYVSRNGIEIEFFSDLKDAMAWIQHVYGLTRRQASEKEINIYMMRKEPKPGDLVRAVIDSEVSTGMVDKVTETEIAVCFNPHAFRADESVSISGGPVLYFSREKCRFYRIEPATFWRWKCGYPKGGHGGYYKMSVPCWSVSQ